MALPEGVDFESLLEQLTKMYEAMERLVFVRKAHLGGEGQGEFKEAQEQTLVAVGKSKKLAEKFKNDSQKGGFNLQTFIAENSDELQTVAREMHDSNERAGNSFHDQIGGANPDYEKPVEIAINGEKVRASLHDVHNELQGPNDKLKQAFGWPQVGAASAQSAPNTPVTGGNMQIDHDARPWTVAKKVAPDKDRKTTIQVALDKFNAQNGSNFALVNKNGGLVILDGKKALNPEQQAQLNKIMIAQVPTSQPAGPETESFWQGLVSSGYIEGDAKYYSSGKAKPDEYEHALKTAWETVEKSNNKAEKDKFWSGMVEQGFIEGDSNYYASGDAQISEYDHAFEVASGLKVGSANTEFPVASGPNVPPPSHLEANPQSGGDSNADSSNLVPPGTVVNPVNPAIKSFWQGLVDDGHIEGDPSYYFSGQASEEEYKHAFKTALAAVDATGDQDEKDKFWTGMVAAGYIEGDPLYYSRAQAGTAEYDNAINVASGTAETRAFWEGLVSSGHIQGDPEYYYSGKASPEEYKHAFKTAWDKVNATGNQAEKDKFWAGMVSSGYIEGDPTYYSSGKAQASEFNNAFVVASGSAPEVTATANVSAGGNTTSGGNTSGGNTSGGDTGIGDLEATEEEFINGVLDGAAENAGDGTFEPTSVATTDRVVADETGAAMRATDKRITEAKALRITEAKALRITLPYINIEADKLEKNGISASEVKKWKTDAINATKANATSIVEGTVLITDVLPSKPALACPPKENTIVALSLNTGEQSDTPSGGGNPTDALPVSGVPNTTAASGASEPRINSPTGTPI